MKKTPASEATSQPAAASWGSDVPPIPRGAPSERALHWALRAGTLAALALLTIGTPAPQSAIRRDEVECEEAVAHLSQCCPALHPQAFKCEYDENYGCGDPTRPELSISKSQEIRAMSCDQVVASGWCDGAGTP